MEKKRNKTKKMYRLYLDSSQLVEKRVRDPLSRMTLEEKVSQFGANSLEDILDDDRFSVRKLKKMLSDLGTGVLQNINKDSRLNLEIIRRVREEV